MDGSQMAPGRPERLALLVSVAGRRQALRMTEDTTPPAEKPKNLDELLAACTPKRKAQFGRLLGKYLEAKWAREAEEHRQAEEERQALDRKCFGDDD